jgi:hypothetical protein
MSWFVGGVDIYFSLYTSVLFLGRIFQNKVIQYSNHPQIQISQDLIYLLPLENKNFHKDQSSQPFIQIKLIFH